MTTPGPSVFELLRPFSWRGIQFPVAKFSTDIQQDHTAHLYPDRDGGHIEATGRAPLVIDAHAMFLNGIAPGQQEKWGVLYPDTFRSFVGACADKTTGELQHPELGILKCKVRSAKIDWEASRRDGAVIDVSWVESTDSANDLDALLTASSPVSATLQFALDLDTQIFQINKPLVAANEITFADSIRSIQAVFDQATLLSRKGAGLIDRVVYRLGALGDSVSALRDCTTWPITNSIQRLLSALLDLKKQLLVSTKKIGIYVTPGRMTFSQIVVATGSKVSDLINLNTNLAGSLVIEAHTQVRYYV